MNACLDMSDHEAGKQKVKWNKNNLWHEVWKEVKYEMKEKWNGVNKNNAWILLHQINKNKCKCTQVSHTPRCTKEKMYLMFDFFFVDNINYNIYKILLGPRLNKKNNICTDYHIQ